MDCCRKTTLVLADGTKHADDDGDLVSVGAEKTQFHVYKKRWYVLVVYNLVSLVQFTVYGTFGPIAQSCETALEMTQTDFALLANWYNVGYLALTFPFIWLVEKKGLRLSMAVTTALCAIGASLRCIHTGDHAVDKTFIHLGQLVNSFAAPVLWFGCTKISADWFPPKERNLATSLSLSLSSLGSTLYFLVGPLFLNMFKGSGTPEEIYDAIYKLLYVEAFICNILLVVVILDFPSKPRTPPSFSATTKRYSYCEGFRHFVTNRNAWIMFVVLALNTLTGTWDSFFDVMEEIEVGWVGTVMEACQNIACPLFALLLRMRWLATRAQPVSVGLVSVGCTLFAVFVLASTLPSLRFIYSRALIVATIPAFEVLVTLAQPVWWEMTCDTLYPVPESVVSGMLTYGTCVASLIFYIVLLFPQLGYMWLNWAVLIGEILVVPLLLVYHNDGKRTKVDQEQKANSAEALLPEKISADDSSL